MFNNNNNGVGKYFSLFKYSIIILKYYEYFTSCYFLLTVMVSTHTTSMRTFILLFSEYSDLILSSWKTFFLTLRCVYIVSGIYRDCESNTIKVVYRGTNHEMPIKSCWFNYNIISWRLTGRISLKKEFSVA